MARQAQTATAVLGVLSIGDLTGYEVRQAITSVLGHFWHESFGQIYPTLAELVRDGLVSAGPGDRARSTRYRITTTGRARLRKLLAEPPESQAPRNGLLLRIFFGRSLNDEALADLLDDVEGQAGSRLATYSEIREGMGDDPSFPVHGRYWEATLRAGELAAEAQLRWVAETRAALLTPATLPPL